MSKLLNNKSVVNIGIEQFACALRQQMIPVAQIDWRPPAYPKLTKMLEKTYGSPLWSKMEAANKQAVNNMISAEPFFVGILPAKDVVPGMKPNMILHSGPPIDWERMLPAQQKGIIGGVLHEKLAKNDSEALEMISRGEILIESANDHYCCGAGVGIVTYNMVVNVCRDKKTGLEGYCIPFEGRVGLGVWGVYNDEVERNLKIIEQEFAPSVTEALNLVGGINVRNIIAKGLQMSDEMHTRQTAGGLLLVNEIVPLLLKTGSDYEVILRCIDQFTSTERWFHPLALASAMSISRSAMDIPYCTIVTASVQNGVETGIKVSGLGSKWFYAPSPTFTGSYFSSQWGPKDATPFMGDSTVSEVVGMGGFAAAASPIVLRLRDGGYREAIEQTEEMKQISFGINTNYPIPLLDFTGPGIGIDIRKIVDTGITPLCHGGIISKEGGQIGAGAARFPSKHYAAALEEMLQQLQMD